MSLVNEAKQTIKRRAQKPSSSRVVVLVCDVVALWPKKKQEQSAEMLIFG